MDHADNTLWLVNDDGSSAGFGVLEQYSRTGTFVSTGLNVGFILAGEFDLGAASATPEPSTWLLFFTAGLGLAGYAGRKSIP